MIQEDTLALFVTRQRRKASASSTNVCTSTRTLNQSFILPMISLSVSNYQTIITGYSACPEARVNFVLNLKKVIQIHSQNFSIKVRLNLEKMFDVDSLLMRTNLSVIITKKKKLKIPFTSKIVPTIYIFLGTKIKSRPSLPPTKWNLRC